MPRRVKQPKDERGRFISHEEAARRALLLQSQAAQAEAEPASPAKPTDLVTSSVGNALSFRQPVARTPSSSPPKVPSRYSPDCAAPSPQKTFDGSVLPEPSEVQLAQSISRLSLLDPKKLPAEGNQLEPKSPFFRRNSVLRIQPPEHRRLLFERKPYCTPVVKASTPYLHNTSQTDRVNPLTLTGITCVNIPPFTLSPTGKKYSLENVRPTNLIVATANVEHERTPVQLASTRVQSQSAQISDAMPPRTRREASNDADADPAVAPANTSAGFDRDIPAPASLVPPQDPPVPCKYTRTEYVQDAALIHFAAREIQIGHYSSLREMLAPAIVSVAATILKVQPKLDRQLLDATILGHIHEGKSPLTSNEEFARIVTRFVETEVVDDPDPSPRRFSNSKHGSSSSSHVSDRQPQREARSIGQPPLSRLRDAEQETVDVPPQLGTFSTRRQTGMESGYTERYQQPPPTPSRPPRQRAPSTTYSSQTSHRRSFKAEILALDTSKTPISAYISQLEWLATTHGEDVVLENIVPGLLSQPSSDGCRWFQSLNMETRRRLAVSLNAWKDLLHQRFRKDRGALMVEADNLKHSFANEHELSLQEYIDRKLALYNEAGDMDEDAKARRLILGTDPALSKLIDVDPDHVTVDRVKQQLTLREWTARRDWTAQQQAVASTEQQLKDLTRQLKDLRDGNRDPRNMRRPDYYSRGDYRDQFRGDRRREPMERDREGRFVRERRQDFRPDRGNEEYQRDRFRREDRRSFNARDAGHTPPRADRTPRDQGREQDRSRPQPTVKAYPATVSFEDEPPYDEDLMDVDPQYSPQRSRASRSPTLIPLDEPTN